MSTRRQDLHPLFQPIDAVIFTTAQAALDGQYKGSKIVDGETMRTPAAQAADAAAGSSQVTCGWHEYGLARDFHILDENGQEVTNGEDPRYRLVGDIAKAQGCFWGGDWVHHPDWDHYEWHPGFTLAIYQAWLRSNPPPVIA